MFFKSFCLFSDFFIRTKKLYLLLDEFAFFMKKNWIIEIPGFIKNTMLKCPFICQKAGIDYIWIFSEKRSCSFVCISKITKGPFILLKILRFSLKNEISNSKTKLKNFTEIPVLLLNNFSSILKHEILLETVFKDIFFFGKRKKLIMQKQQNVVFFDFIKNTKIIECRFYKFWGTLLLFPRMMRKKNFSNHKNKNKKKKLVEEFTLILKKKNTACSSSLIIEEVGPRLTFRLLEILGNQKMW